MIMSLSSEKYRSLWIGVAGLVPQERGELVLELGLLGGERVGDVHALGEPGPGLRVGLGGSGGG